jgi:TolB-like protein/Tfp pilus assembly protein PilF
MSDSSTKAVFLSYASQDAEAARRICEALRSGGVEVWFDADGGLEHGDEWDAKIRKQIKECVLFIPIISANTQARHEGYFRIEWELAAQRAMGIASGVAFILPVVIDHTREPEALVPDRFRAVQWTKLPGGVVTPEVKARYLKLWSHRVGAATASNGGQTPEGGSQRAEEESLKEETKRRRLIRATVIALPLIAAAVWGFSDRFSATSKPETPNSKLTSPAPLSEARKLVTQARLQLDKPEMARVELSAADGFCKRAAEIDDGDAEVWATWSQVNTWFVYYNFDGSLARREAARDYAARAMQLAPRSFEARLAQACYWMRGEGLDVGFAGDEKPPLYQAEAERMLRELHAEKPDEPRTLLMLGFFRVWKDVALPERFDLLERATRNPAFAAEAWKEIGWVKFFQGDPVAAVSAAERSIAAQPTWNNLWLKTLLATVWLGDLDLAKATLDRMPATASQEDVGLFLVYWVYAWRNEPLVALGMIERQPRDWLRMSGYIGPKALLTGKLRRMANQPEIARRDFVRARDLLEQALATDQNNRNLLSLKAQALHFLGEDDEARRMYRLAYDLGARGPELEGLFNSPETVFDTLNSYLESLQDRPNLAWYFTAAALRFNPECAALKKHARFPALLARLDADPRFSPTAKPLKPVGASTIGDPKSVAVLAFKNLSDDKANEYFSDGISEELLNALGKVPGLKVSGRTSSFSFKDKNLPAAEIARQLNVSHLVDGSVQKEGANVRISAQLINAADGFQLWSETFRREVKSVLALQEEIAGLIATKLSLKLGPGASAASASVNPEAFELYLQGRQAWNLRTTAGFERAEECFNRALALDPNFARAHAGLADLWTVRGGQEGTLSQFDQRNSPQIQKILGFARRAIELDPSLADAHAALGNIHWNAWNSTEGARELRAAVVLNPNYASAHQWLGRVLLSDGRMDEALQALRRAHELEPLAHKIADNFGIALIAAQRHAEALTMVERALTLQPDSIWALAMRVQCLAELARPEDAIRTAGFPADSAPPNLRSSLSYSLARAGARAESEKMIRAIAPLDRNAVAAAALLLLGQREDCFRTLESGSRMVLAIDTLFFWPVFDEIRHEPRFTRMLAELGLTEAHARAQVWRAAHPPEKVTPKK